MALVTLLMLALFIGQLNRSRYLHEYRTSRLPRLGTLVLLLTTPLVLVDRHVANSWLHLSWLLLLIAGGLASFIDWERHLLPDRLVLPVLAASVILIATTSSLPEEIIGGLVGGLGWFSLFAFLAMINPVGLGWGDVKFAALLGFDCGAIDLKLVPIAFFLAIVTGGAYALFAIVKGNRRTEIPFGPFMFLGALLSLIATSPI